jgi:DNA gyrase subunit B
MYPLVLALLIALFPLSPRERVGVRAGQSPPAAFDSARFGKYWYQGKAELTRYRLEQARYGRIICMADADSDGAHIRCLLATLFFKYMPDIVTAGRLFTAVPPLHRIELTNPKRGMEKYIYTYSDPELQRKLAELTKKGVRWEDPVQRYKGLGEMDADQLAETTMDPRRRTLRKLTVDDADEAAKVFELLMGSEVAPRKEFLVQGAYEEDVEALDA